MTRRKYEEPPISEVICEFRFKPSAQWDFTSPGMFYQIIQDEYPKRQQTGSIEGGFFPLEQALQQRTIIVQRSKFLSEDENSFLQLSPHYLSIHQKKPYDSWELFVPVVTRALNAYKTAIGFSDIQRIGLRYINKIEFDTSYLEMEDYFDFYAHMGSNIPQTHAQFRVAVDIPYSSEGRLDFLRLQLYSDGSSSNVSTTLDLDYFTGTELPGDEQSVSNWLETGHTHINTCFEGSIKDSLRVKFKEVR